MTRHIIRLLAIACFVGPLCISSAAGGDDVETKKKLEQMRKELDDLSNKEKAIAKQREELQKAVADLQQEINRKAEARRQELIRQAEARRVQEAIEQKKFDEADKKKHHVKVELRGKLMRVTSVQTYLPTVNFYVLTNETYWPLQLTNAKEQLETATKLLGKPVVVAGTISTQTRLNPQMYPSYPEDWVGPGPYPGRYPRIEPTPPANPTIPATPFTPGVGPTMLPVTVESIRLFEEK